MSENSESVDRLGCAVFFIAVLLSLIVILGALSMHQLQRRVGQLEVEVQMLKEKR